MAVVHLGCKAVMVVQVRACMSCGLLGGCRCLPRVGLPEAGHECEREWL